MDEFVELSSDLIRDAKAAASLSRRSMAEQIEFWAQLGQAVESRLWGEHLLAQRTPGASRSLYDAIIEVDSAKGKERVRDYLQKRPFSHFEASVGQPGLVYKIDEDGTRILGRFVNRQFVAADKL